MNRMTSSALLLGWLCLFASCGVEDGSSDHGDPPTPHSIEILNVPYDEDQDVEWIFKIPKAEEIRAVGRVVFDETDLLGVEEAGSKSHHKFVFRKESMPRLLTFLESSERGTIFVAVDGVFIDASLGGCRPCQSIDGTFPSESIDLINTILSYEPSTKLIGEQDGARRPATAPDSKSKGKEKPKPESEGRSQ